MQIRKLSRNDLPFLLDIENKCFKDPWSQYLFEGALLDEQCLCLGADDNGRLISYSIFLFIPNVEAQVLSIATIPEYRRKGIAEKLFSESINAANALGIYEYTLEVRKSNLGAIALYNKLGFKDEGIRPSYYQDGEDAVIMWRRDK